MKYLLYQHGEHEFTVLTPRSDTRTGVFVSDVNANTPEHAVEKFLKNGTKNRWSVGRAQLVAREVWRVSYSR